MDLTGRGFDLAWISFGMDLTRQGVDLAWIQLGQNLTWRGFDMLDLVWICTGDD